jgi:hypothetical protein
MRLIFCSNTQAIIYTLNRRFTGSYNLANLSWAQTNRLSNRVKSRNVRELHIIRNIILCFDGDALLVVNNTMRRNQNMIVDIKLQTLNTLHNDENLVRLPNVFQRCHERVIHLILCNDEQCVFLCQRLFQVKEIVDHFLYICRTNRLG